MIKKYIRTLHLWLGLIIGLLVFIISVTGCFYAFQKEIQDFTDEYRFVIKENKPVLLPSEIRRIVRKELPGKNLHSIKYYKDNHSIEATFYHQVPLYYYIMYINPYSGKVLHTQNMEEGFFPFILKGHMYLWLPQDMGRILVLIVTLLFFTIVLSGFILWLPKNWYILKKRIWFNWKSSANWKRKNWDLHSIIGFYTISFALLFIITGLVWVMPNFANWYHQAFGGEKSLVYEEPLSRHVAPVTNEPLDALYHKYYSSGVNFAHIELHPPETENSSISVVINPSYDTYWRSDYVYYNPFSLKELRVNHIWGHYQEANTADKLLRLNYDIHVGSVLGLTGKIIAFLMSLMIASLPVTGFLIWYGRWRKNNH
ncbi:PepSY domain-containing protein [Cytophagaceae bacterium 50C-KIRBA]|uniref:PepSY domain-containing protein n=1 Tax=Aquirufa beregesia TaxID=2516556 RepID=A0ABX0EW50_9BACT|nr:PepSY-associated TM helix domain-containing protein [Aquirufa beregesia]NGZ43593.1 PepSY domain-containing protein [Aquirufa beregesia]